MEYQYPPVGCVYEEDGAAFTVWAPQKAKVELVLSDKIYPMHKDSRGYWNYKAKNVEPGDVYEFRIDGEYIMPDPASRWQPHGIHKASAVASPVFDWKDESWEGLSLSEMIIYELHVGTFTARGTFDGVISKLDYLKDLGINTIELMPVAQFPGTRNWGYDGVFPFAVQDSYGGIKGLKGLVNAAHQKGMAVLLDVVYNHLGPEGNYLGQYAPYFTDKYHSFWGKAINFDGAYSDGVRHYFWQNALMWLDEFHIDGLRLDAVHAIWDLSARHFLEILAGKVKDLQAQKGRTKVLIAETDLNNPRYINPSSKGGYDIDGQWMDEFHHALHTLLTDERDGYYEDFGKVEHLTRAYRDSYVYSGQYSMHRKRNFGRLPLDNPYDQFVVFAQNHDQVGNRMPGDRLSQNVSFEGLKLAAAAYLLSPHIPMLFMGEEYGEKHPFQYFINHTDAELVEQVREGRKREFAHFHWKGEVPDPQSKKTFEQCILSWKTDKQAKKLLEFYQYLIALRKEKPVIRVGQRESLHILEINEEDKVLAFERYHDEEYLLFILNFNKGEVWLDMPVSFELQKIFDSSDKRWLGPGSEAFEATNSGLTLNPQSMVIFERA